MSAIVEIVRFEKTDLKGLRDAAVPKKRLFGAPRDLFWDFVRQRGTRLADYEWSGFFFLPLFGFLKDRLQVDLLEADFNELGKHISEARRSVSAFVFSTDHKQRWTTLLHQDVSEEDLLAYHREFSEREEPDAGRAMLEGLAVLRSALSQLDESSIVLLCIAV